MRGIYISPWFGIVGAVLGAAIALVPFAVPWPIYGWVKDPELILLIPPRWGVVLAIVGAVTGGILGALAGRSIVEAAYGLFRRIASWLPWSW